MVPVPFGNSYRDCSTSLGFQFEFYCGRCGNGYRSTVQSTLPSSAGGFLAGKVGGLLPGMLGDFAGDRASDMVKDKGKETALYNAQKEMINAFALCPRDGHWVCRARCWNVAAGMCLTCAPMPMAQGYPPTPVYPPSYPPRPPFAAAQMPYYAPAPPGYPPASGGPAHLSGLAIVSVLFGLFPFALPYIIDAVDPTYYDTTSPFVAIGIALFASTLAILCGVSSLAHMKRSQGQITGKRAAQTGVVLGIAGSLILIIGSALFVSSMPHIP